MPGAFVPAAQAGRQECRPSLEKQTPPGGAAFVE